MILKCHNYTSNTQTNILIAANSYTLTKYKRINVNIENGIIQCDFGLIVTASVIA